MASGRIAGRHRTLQVEHAFLLSALLDFQRFVFASELPVDQKIVEFQPHHCLESFRSLPVKLQLTLNQSQASNRGRRQGIRAGAFSQNSIAFSGRFSANSSGRRSIEFRDSFRRVSALFSSSARCSIFLKGLPAFFVPVTDQSHRLVVT